MALAWAELQRRGTPRPRYLQGLEEEIAAELARCFDPFIFEQAIRPAWRHRRARNAASGAARTHRQHGGPDARRRPQPGGRAEHVRPRREGRAAAASCSPTERIDTEQDYASHAAWVDGLIIVCNNAGRHGSDRDGELGHGRPGRRWIAKTWSSRRPRTSWRSGAGVRQRGRAPPARVHAPSASARTGLAPRCSISWTRRLAPTKRRRRRHLARDASAYPS